MIMSKSLSESLSQFVSSMSEETNSFENPFSEDAPDIEGNVRESIRRSDDHKRERKKKKKQNKFDRVMSEGDQMIASMTDDDMIDDFDGFLDRYFMEDEDVELRQNLVKYGRQYARDTRTSGESSEVTKAYAKSEALLTKLLDDVDSDTEAIQKDIAALRMARSRNFKALSDLVEAKSQMHSTKLNAIKEMNNMKKSQFDIQLKVKKAHDENDGDSSTATRAVQQLFGMNREALMGTLGGYAGISGSDEAGREDDDFDQYEDLNEDEEIQKRYFSDTNEPETDGDKFLKYEGMGVHYILLYDENDYREIIAEDKDGNIIPDYPKPDPEDLDFEMSISAGTATDNLANQYELRRI